VTWSRGPKVAATNLAMVRKSVALWNEELLTITSSINRDVKTGAFDRRLAKFSVKDVRISYIV